MVIKSFVGGHAVNIYADCVFDPSIRKYRGGKNAKCTDTTGFRTTVALRWL